MLLTYRKIACNNPSPLSSPRCHSCLSNTQIICLRERKEDNVACVVMHACMCVVPARLWLTPQLLTVFSTLLLCFKQSTLNQFFELKTTNFLFNIKEKSLFHMINPWFPHNNSFFLAVCTGTFPVEFSFFPPWFRAVFFSSKSHFIFTFTHSLAALELWINRQHWGKRFTSSLSSRSQTGSLRG